MNGFIHLNVHSHYSQGRGVATIEELCVAAQENGFRKLALTDTNGLYGLVFFVQKAREIGIDPILGSEVRFNEEGGGMIVRADEGSAVFGFWTMSGVLIDSFTVTH